MNIQETAQLLLYIKGLWSSFKVTEVSIAAWAEVFAADPQEAVKEAVLNYAKGRHEYPPDAAKIAAELMDLTNPLLRLPAPPGDPNLSTETYARTVEVSTPSGRLKKTRKFYVRNTSAGFKRVVERHARMGLVPVLEPLLSGSNAQALYWLPSQECDRVLGENIRIRGLFVPRYNRKESK